MSSRICVISAAMEMNMRRSVSGLRIPTSCFSCSGFWSIRACCVGCDGCSSFLFIHMGLGLQRLISVLSAYFHAAWSSSFCSGCLSASASSFSASSYSARSCSRLMTGITSIAIWRSWIVEMAAFCAAVYFGCLSGLNVVLLIDLLWLIGFADFVFKMLFEINSIFFGDTAVRGSHFAVFEF